MTRIQTHVRVAVILLVLAFTFAACSKSPKYDTNLLKNGSFEKVGSDGVPRNWKLVIFRGSPDEPGVRYGVDTLAVDGKRSWFFQGDPGTRRWYFLQQELKVSGAKSVRVRGWILGDDVRMRPQQFAMCNFLLTFYDKDHHRFQVERQADRRTPLRPGTYPWEEQVYTFPVPEGTEYVAVSCLLSMNGTAWFDNVSLEIPQPTPWQTETTKNYVFHWLPDHPMPAGAPQEQQKIFDHYATALGVKSDAVINYYFYPDSATIQKMIGIKGDMYVSWDDYDFHTIRDADDHEVVHFITDSIGRPPRCIAEGTVIWLQDRFGDKSLDDQLRVVVRDNKVTPFASLFEYTQFSLTDPKYSLATSAGLIKYLAEKYGNENLIELYRAINGMNSYATIAKAFESVYQTPMDKAENDFRLWMFSRYGK